MHQKNYLSYSLFIAGSLLLSHCGSEDVSKPILSTIKINSSNGNRLDLFTNGNTELTASGFDQYERSIEIEELVWSVNNDHVSIGPNGVAEAMSIGSSTILASSGNVTATYKIEVWDSSAPRTEYYVSDAGNFEAGFQILLYDENGENGKVFTNKNLAWPQDIIFLEDEKTVLISNLSSGKITKYDISTGEYMGLFATNIQGPTRMMIGADNLLYVLQWQGKGHVLRYQLDGTFLGEFTSEGVAQSIGIAWDKYGNLYISSFSDAHVRKFDSEGKDLGLFITSNLVGPTNIWFDDNGNLFVSDWTAGNIKKFDSNGTLIQTVVSGLSKPEGIVLIGNGNFMIGNGGTRSIKEFNNDGSYIRDFVSSGSAGLLTPNAIKRRDVNR